MIMGIVTLTLGLIVLVYLLTKKIDLQSQDKNRTETRYMWIYIYIDKIVPRLCFISFSVYIIKGLCLKQIIWKCMHITLIVNK